MRIDIHPSLVAAFLMRFICMLTVTIFSGLSILAETQRNTVHNEHVYLVDTGRHEVKTVRHAKDNSNVNPADLMTKPLLGPKIAQFMKIMGYEFVG